MLKPTVPHKHRQQQPKKKKYVQKSSIKSQSTQQTSLVANNIIDTTTSSSAGINLGQLSALSYPVHPSNFLLFPNLKGIWRSFQQYRMDTTTIDCKALASTLASGAYACTLVPSTDVESNLLPIFSTLINYATTTASTIWKPMLYKFAGNILHRLGSYLMQSNDVTTSSPGTLMLSKTQSPVSNSNAVDIMPIFNLKSKVHLKNFVPAAPSPSPIQMGINGIYFNSAPTGNAVFLASNYVPMAATTPPDFTVATSTNPNNWFMIKQIGPVQLIITVGRQSTSNWIPRDFFVNGVKINPTAVRQGSLGNQFVYNFQSNGKALVSSTSAPGWLNVNVGSVLNNIAVSFYIGHASLSRKLQRHHRHSEYFTIDKAQFLQIIRHGQNYVQNVYATNVNTTIVTPQFDDLQGYCWLRCLQKFAGVMIQYHKTYILLIKGPVNIRIDLKPLISTSQFLKAIVTLDAQKQFEQKFQVSIQKNIAHVQYSEHPSSHGLQLLSFVDFVGYIDHQAISRFFRANIKTVSMQYNSTTSQYVVKCKQQTHKIIFQQLTVIQLQSLMKSIKLWSDFKSSFIWQYQIGQLHVLRKSGAIASTMRRMLAAQIAIQRQLSQKNHVAVYVPTQIIQIQDDHSIRSRAQIQNDLVAAGIHPNPGPVQKQRRSGHFSVQEEITDDQDKPPDK